MLERKIFIVTLFPEYFEPLKDCGVVGRAISKVNPDSHLKISLETIQLRDFALGNYKSVDDYPFGGGPGMVLRADILANCINTGILEKFRINRSDLHIIFPSPRGQVFNNKIASSYAQNYLNIEPKINKSLVFICGRYEGIDERFIENYVDEHISLGDFIISGGEIATMCIIDASLRYVDGVLGNIDSHKLESFEEDLLEHPHFTRPREFEGIMIPEVLQSGHHKNIENYKVEESLRLTKKHRPDLWRKYEQK